MVAVELTILTLISTHHHDVHVRIRSDNQGVVGALKAGYSRGQAQNASLRRIVQLMQEHSIWLTVDWIAS
ncbi:hypothetical protein K435DRAFT_558052, partial [Dendrothele bispora CBS 962.96]